MQIEFYRIHHTNYLMQQVKPLDLGFKKDEITDLITKTIEISGDESRGGIEGLKEALNEFNYFDKNAEKIFQRSNKEFYPNN